LVKTKLKLHVSFLLLLASGTTAVRGQSALDGFDPNANAAVHVVAVGFDGKMFIAGDFSTLAPNGGAVVTHNLFAALNLDGTVNTNFNPNPNGQVLSIAVLSHGKILVGGNFSFIGGQPRHGLARLDGITGLADSFDPNPNGDVYAVTIPGGDEHLLIGGSFTSIGGQPRNRIARLDGITGLADSFDPNANGLVQTIVVQTDGRILVGGSFGTIGGQGRSYLARLDPTTGLADSFNPNPNNIVRSIAEQADGKIVAGGQFTFIGGQFRNFIARLDATTGLADSFNPSANNQVYSIAIQPDGRILAGGLFNGANSIGGQARNYLARLNEITGLADSFDPNVTSGIVFAISLQDDGKIVAGGIFASLSPNGGAAVTRNNIARLEKDGRLDQTLNLNMVGTVVGAIAVQPDGKFLIGGEFTSVLGVPRTNIARLHTDGTLDTVFNPNANGAVNSIVVLGDGKILVGGAFSGPNSIGGAARNYIARLDGVTGAADSFDPQINGGISSMTTQGDGKILICGSFTNVGGLARKYLARLNSNGTLDAAFNPDPNSYVGTIAVQFYDGKILAGGDFTSIGGQPRNRIARLDATNGLADSSDPNADNVVSSIAVNANSPFVGYSALVGGSFTNIGGLAQSHFAVLDDNGFAASDYPGADGLVSSIVPQSDGAVLLGGEFLHIDVQPRKFIGRIDILKVDSFDPKAATVVNSLALQPDGKILVGGFFNGTNSIGGQTRNYFARLSNDTAVHQRFFADSLFTSDESIIWIVEGSSPQFSRVTFEISTNNVNYSFLGNSTFATSTWYLPLQDLNPPIAHLPVGQNFYVRARGYYSTGYLNGSGSIQESIWIVYIPVPPPFLNIQLIANTNVVLSWLTNFTGFTLESNTNLTTTNWSVVSPSPSVSDTNYVVTNAISGPARFYRLRL
jgi:uncharacterized delta-60 repeat protein